MTMRTPLLILCAIAFSYSSFSQVRYTDFDPDETIQMPVATGDRIDFDVDGDNSDDFSFSYTNYPSFGIWNLGIVQLDTNNPKIEIMIDNTTGQSQIGDYYVKQLNAGETVSASAQYSDDYPQIADIYAPNFQGQTGKYLAFRLKKGNDYQYGWMAVEFAGTADYTCTISEMAYEETNNKEIEVGQKQSVGIEEGSFEAAGLSLYPNPSNGLYYIQNSKGKDVEEVKIYNINGSLIERIAPTSWPLQINAETWEKGSYILQILAEDQSYQRLLVRH